MKRTTVVLSADLRARALRAARDRGLSFSDLVRRGIERELAASEEEDSLFRRIPLPPGANPPRDLARNLDAYLYGPTPSSSMPALSSRTGTRGTRTTRRSKKS